MVKLKATNLSMHFGAKRLFTATELTFCQGDVIYLQGDNGSGKSTLMKLLAGLVPPSTGHITHQGFNKTPWWKWTHHPLLGKAVYLHQHPYLFEGSVEYNLLYGLPFSELSRAALKSRIQRAITMAQLEPLLDQNASDLSGGERQRLAIARAWIMQPKLLMLDEPISNMDQDSRYLVVKMIEQLKQEGTGLLISSHQSCALTAMCKQHWHIENEQIRVTDKLNFPSPTQEHLYVVAN